MLQNAKSRGDNAVGAKLPLDSWSLPADNASHDYRVDTDAIRRLASPLASKPKTQPSRLWRASRSQGAALDGQLLGEGPPAAFLEVPGPDPSHHRDFPQRRSRHSESQQGGHMNESTLGCPQRAGAAQLRKESCLCDCTEPPPPWRASPSWRSSGKAAMPARRSRRRTKTYRPRSVRQGRTAST